MLPPAPTLFSTTNCCPSRSPIFAPMTRATVSVGPPAEKETTMRTGLDGYLSSAFAPAPPSAYATTMPAKTAGHRCVSMVFSPRFCEHDSTSPNPDQLAPCSLLWGGLD